MNIRRAVWYLAGWYLLVPPFQGPGGEAARRFQGDLAAPFSDWRITGSYDAAAGCQAERNKVIEAGLRMRADTSSSRDDLDFAEVLSVAQCVSTDDPRLKGN